MLAQLDPSRALPRDAARATLIGRAFLPASHGPSPIVVRDGAVWDLAPVAATVSELLNLPDPVRAVRSAPSLARIGTIEALLANSDEETRDASRPWLLAPNDLQAIKAAGVTFVSSMLERVIEEQARGDPAKAESVRRALVGIIGEKLSVKPGSDEAAKVKDALIAQKAWSQYLEVGIGPDAEIFTKAQPMSAVGTGADIGIHPKSSWNNPEPEIVLAVAADGRVVGATLGNDVNLRDFEGRSALLLSKAKDNTGSCAIGPFVRLFDEHYARRRRAPRRHRAARRGTRRVRARRRELDVRRSAATRWTSRTRRWPGTTSTRMGSCSTSARCSRRSRTATGPGRASRMWSATS